MKTETQIEKLIRIYQKVLDKILIVNRRDVINFPLFEIKVIDVNIVQNYVLFDLKIKKDNRFEYMYNLYSVKDYINKLIWKFFHKSFNDITGTNNYLCINDIYFLN
jgi:hypothetical protein